MYYELKCILLFVVFFNTIYQVYILVLLLFRILIRL